MNSVFKDYGFRRYLHLEKIRKTENRLSSNYQKLTTCEILEDKDSIAGQLLIDPSSLPTNRLLKRS